jgi:flavodoxin I
MSDTGLFFASTTGNCETIARIIAKCFKPYGVCIHDVMHTSGKTIDNYQNLIFGIPSWFKRNIHEDWQEFLPMVHPASLKEKKIAIYGSADQKSYPDNFADGMAMLYFWLLNHQANIVGSWPVTGYNFRKSQALIDGKFIGLVIDEDVQSHLTAARVSQWVENLKTEFKL